jgi:hypothetical protein
MELTGGCVCGGRSFGFAQDRLYQKLIGDSPSFICAGRFTASITGEAPARLMCNGDLCRAGDLVVTKGEPHKIPHANRIRSFAACCGTHLFFEDTKDSDMIDVTIASLDDPTPFTPQKAIFLEDKLPWVVIDESIPSFQTSPEEGLTTNGHE